VRGGVGCARVLEDLRGSAGSDAIVELTALIRRVVAARVSDADTVSDIVQETLVRLLAARPRLAERALGPYAIVVARNLVASHWRHAAHGERLAHRLHDPRQPAAPEERIVEREEAQAIRAALERLSPRERDVLVGHELDGRPTADLADDVGSTAGAVAARLNRSRAKLRVEYLLELAGEPPTASCRPVLLSLSGGDRRRQAELDVGYHLLECDFCAGLGDDLFDRRPQGPDDEVRVPIRVDADIVKARQLGHGVATRAGFMAAEATVVATAISEVARNIVRFARRGEIAVSPAVDGDTSGVTVVARDTGPGITDLEQALEVGFTTYGGRGLGLPGCRRMMDEFEITSEPGRGTTVTMTKWRRM
jgi:RNA polymerase sigma factor (sigma-70 family)